MHASSLRLFMQSWFTSEVLRFLYFSPYFLMDGCNAGQCWLKKNAHDVVHYSSALCYEWKEDWLSEQSIYFSCKMIPLLLETIEIPTAITSWMIFGQIVIVICQCPLNHHFLWGGVRRCILFEEPTFTKPFTIIFSHNSCQFGINTLWLKRSDNFIIPEWIDDWI